MITIGFSLPWGYLLVSGGGQERYTKAIGNSANSSVLTGTRCEMSVLIRRAGVNAPANHLIPFLTFEQGRLCIYELMAEESAVNYWEVSFLASICPYRLAD